MMQYSSKAAYSEPRSFLHQHLIENYDAKFTYKHDLLNYSDNYLSILSHPAWSNPDEKEMFDIAAISLWIQRYRMDMGMRNTISDIITSVKEVIPDSKLAHYGDFKYDVHREITSYALCEGSFLCSPLKRQKSNVAAKEFHAEILPHIHERYDKELHFHPLIQRNVEQEDFRMESLKPETAIDRWLVLLLEFLISVTYASQCQSRCLNNDILNLLNECIWFTFSARLDKGLLALMDCEMPFVIYRNVLLEEPGSRVELLSIPQPYLPEHPEQDNGSLEKLFIKISSPDVRKIWLGNIRSSMFGFLSPSIAQNLGLSSSVTGVTTFLKRKPSESFSKTSADVEISNAKAEELLGSLLTFINESDEILSSDKDFHENTFQMSSEECFPTPTLEELSIIPETANKKAIFTKGENQLITSTTCQVAEPETLKSEPELCSATALQYCSLIRACENWQKQTTGFFINYEHKHENFFETTAKQKICTNMQMPSIKIKKYHQKKQLQKNNQFHRGKTVHKSGIMLMKKTQQKFKAPELTKREISTTVNKNNHGILQKSKIQNKKLKKFNTTNISKEFKNNLELKNLTGIQEVNIPQCLLPDVYNITLLQNNDISVPTKTMVKIKNNDRNETGSKDSMYNFDSKNERMQMLETYSTVIKADKPHSEDKDEKITSLSEWPKLPNSINTENLKATLNEVPFKQLWSDIMKSKAWSQKPLKICPASKALSCTSFPEISVHLNTDRTEDGKKKRTSLFAIKAIKKNRSYVSFSPPKNAKLSSIASNVNHRLLPVKTKRERKAVFHQISQLKNLAWSASPRNQIIKKNQQTNKVRALKALKTNNENICKNSSDILTNYKSKFYDLSTSNLNLKSKDHEEKINDFNIFKHNTKMKNLSLNEECSGVLRNSSKSMVNETAKSPIYNRAFLDHSPTEADMTVQMYEKSHWPTKQEMHPFYETETQIWYEAEKCGIKLVHSSKGTMNGWAHFRNSILTILYYLISNAYL